MDSGASLGVVTTDRELVVRGWNEWVAAATGVPEQGVVGRPLLDFVAGERHDFYRELFAEVIERGTPRVLAPAFHRYLIECAPRLPSSHFSHMQQRVTVAPLRAAADVVGVMITLEDVTPRLDHERDLTQSLEDRPGQRLAEAAAALSSDDWRLRGTAVRSLAQSASVEEIRFLFDALQRDHDDLNVLNSALRVLIAAGRAVIDPLVELLKDEAPNLRMQAALALGELKADAAVPGLLRAVDDEDENVRFHAIEALGRIGAAESVDRLAAIAASGDFFLAFAAVEALGKTDDARVAPLLVGLLDQELLRPAAIETLAAIGDEDSVAPLARIIHDEAVTAPVAAALARIHQRYEDTLGAGSFVIGAAREAMDERALTALAGVAAHESGERVAVATVLGWMGAAALAPLLRLLGQAGLDDTVSRGILAIGADAVVPLVAALEDANPDVRAAAATLLGRLGDRRATSALTDALADTDAAVVAAAAGALAGIGDAAALDGLIALFAHPSAAVRRAAIAGVNAIGASGTAARLRHALDSGDPRVRESALRVAGYFGFPECVPAILAALGDPAEDVRRAALEQLPVLDGADASARLASALAGETPRNRAAAAHALRLCEQPSDGDALIAALQDADPWVRYYAAASLGERRIAGAAKPLAQLARTDTATHVRIAAVTALGTINQASAARVAGELITDHDDDLAVAAVRVLAAIPRHGSHERLELAARSARPALQAAAIGALGSRPQVDAVEVLSWAARLTDAAGLPLEAINGLGRIALAGDQPRAQQAAVGALLELAGDGTHRDRVLTVISRLPEDLVPEVASGLSAVRVSIRVATAEALAAMRHPRASGELARALRDEDAAVRAAAVTAFGKLGTLSVSRTIAAMRHADPDEGVRGRAALACERHGWGPASFQRS